MNGVNFFENFKHWTQAWPESALERNLIRDYLHEKSYTLEDLQKLPPEEAKNLMKEACSYASLKLAEVESKAKFRRTLQAP